MMDALRDLIEGCRWFMTILRVVDGAGLPDAWVGAGAVRDLVWDTWYGRGFEPRSVKDVDVAFFDAANLDAERDRDAEALLRRRAPDVVWDAKNQAAVHTWYPARFGFPVAPLTSTADGVATWPETATAVAVRLVDGELEVLAPLGLDDLLAGVWRRNPRRVSPAEYLARIERKRPHDRWPRVVVLGPDD